MVDKPGNEVVAEPEQGVPSLFSVGEAAKRVGVPASTLRTWERRYDVQPPARSGGRHRRYSLVDLQRLQRMRRLIEGGISAGEAAAMTRAGTTAAPTSAGPAWSLTGRGPRARMLTAAILDLQVDTITDVVSSALDDWGAAATWRRLLLPTLQQIGASWSRTGCGVEIEHVASGAIETVLRAHAARSLTSSSATGGPGLVVLAATPQEAHTLPSSALAACLADLRIRSLAVGSLPTVDLHAAIRNIQAAAVVVWSQSPPTADPEALAEAASVDGLASYAAGPGWTSSTIPPEIPHLTSLTQALTELRGHRRTPPSGP